MTIIIIFVIAVLCFGIATQAKGNLKKSEFVRHKKIVILLYVLSAVLFLITGIIAKFDLKKFDKNVIESKDEQKVVYQFQINEENQSFDFSEYKKQNNLN